MNGDIQDFISRVVTQYDMSGHVLEVGSLDICGSPRRWFTKDGLQKEPTERFPFYLGIDRVQGNGVDLVMSSHDMASKLGANHFDVVISTSQLEHDEQFWITIAQMWQVLKWGGWLILTVPSWRGEPPHDQHDYYRFMPEGVEWLVTRTGFTIEELIDHQPSNDVMCLARKV